MSFILRSAMFELVRRLPAPQTFSGADGSPYLYRWNMLDMPAGGQLYLHRFARGDEDQELHNHPWGGASLILVGGYREERLNGYREERGCPNSIEMREYRPGDTNVVEPDTFHRVDLLEEDCWTLFAVGPKVQSWGFWDRYTGAFTPWREFIERKGLTPT